MKRIAAVLLALGMLSPAYAGESFRFSQYKKWVRHYQTLMGLEQQELVFVHYRHERFCAWVSSPEVPGFNVPVLVGLSEPDWECRNVPPRELALHEMCHIRMRHLELGVRDMSDKQKHEEVRECMKAYRAAEKEQ